MISQVSEYLYRGPRPDNLDELKKLGIQQIINLEEGWFEFFHDKVGMEHNQAILAGVHFLHYPLSDFRAPTMCELQFIDSTIEARVGSKMKTYVHCLHGQDRTGLVCAVFRVREQKWTIDMAIKEMYDMGFHKFPYEFLGWVQALKEFLR